MAASKRLWRSIYRVDLFSAEECREVVEIADAAPDWQQAAVIRGGESTVKPGRRRARKLTVAGERASPGLRERLTPCLDRIEAQVRELDRRHFRLGIDRIRDAQLVDYTRGGFYDWHPDARDPGFRKLTALCYLTDGDSDGVVGGETSFAPPSIARVMRGTSLRRSGAGWRGWLPTVQRPVRGRVIVFDSRIPHRAQRVRRGRKVALNVWFV